jgi:DNA invertase Pin-like site-specific DNA recombinase
MPRLDRLARSTRDLLNTLAAITNKDYDEKKPYQ